MFPDKPVWQVLIPFVAQRIRFLIRLLPLGVYKINSDAAFNSSTRRGGVGIVIRTWLGNAVCCRGHLFASG